MILYTPDLCTLDYVRRHRTLELNQVTEDALLTDLIAEASAEFQQAVRRTCMAYYATLAFDYSRRTVATSTRLNLNVDLLDVEEITNGDSTTVAAADTLMLPGIGYPKFGVVLKDANWVRGSIDTQCLRIEGWWGYAPHYAMAWKQRGVVPAGGLASSASSVTIAGAASVYERRQYWLIGDEIMQVTAINNDVVTLSRGELGTTAATHSADAVIRIWQPLPDIAGAVREMAVYKYKSKDRVGGRIQVFEGGVLTVEDLDRSVTETINRHVKREIA